MLASSSSRRRRFGRSATARSASSPSATTVGDSKPARPSVRASTCGGARGAGRQGINRTESVDEEAGLRRLFERQGARGELQLRRRTLRHSASSSAATTIGGSASASASAPLAGTDAIDSSGRDGAGRPSRPTRPLRELLLLLREAWDIGRVKGEPGGALSELAEVPRTRADMG